MNLSAAAIRRPIATLLLSIALVVAGQFALMPGGPLRTGADRQGRGGSVDTAGNRPRQQQP